MLFRQQHYEEELSIWRHSFSELGNFTEVIVHKRPKACAGGASLNLSHFNQLLAYMPIIMLFK